MNAWGSRARERREAPARRLGGGVMRASALVALAAALLVPASTSEHSPEPPSAHIETATTRHRVTADGAGMRVFLDDEARPTLPPAAPVGTSVPSTLRAVAPWEGPMRETSAPGGGKLVQLDGRFQTYSVARLDPNGNVTVDCVGGDGSPNLLRNPVESAGAGFRLEQAACEVGALP